MHKESQGQGLHRRLHVQGYNLESSGHKGVNLHLALEIIGKILILEF